MTKIKKKRIKPIQNKTKKKLKTGGEVKMVCLALGSLAMVLTNTNKVLSFFNFFVARITLGLHLVYSN